MQKHFRKLRSNTENFIKKYEKELAIGEADLLRGRLSRTENSAKLYEHKYKAKNWPKSQPSVQKYKPVIDKPSTRVTDQVKLELNKGDLKGMSENVENNLDTTQEYSETLVLPDVPEDPVEQLVDTTDLDDEILRRLTRLKFFSTDWCKTKAENTESSTLGVTSTEVDREEKVAVTSIEAVREEVVAVTCTAADRLEFNK